MRRDYEAQSVDHGVFDFAWQTSVGSWENDWCASKYYFVAKRILLDASGVQGVYSDKIPVAEAVDDGICTAKVAKARFADEVLAST